MIIPENFFKGVVAAGHEATAEVACEVLKEGGNAFDAAIAALWVSFNSEPCMSSPGGGGFAQIMTNKGEHKVIDFFCQTPHKKLSADIAHFYPFTINFGGASEEFYIGHASHAVPGMIAGIFKMHQQFATMPMEVLIQPAVERIKRGIPIDEFQHIDIVLLDEMIEQSQEAVSIFKKDNKALEVGELLYMPNLADFIYSMAKEGEREFYEGSIAQKISQDSRDNRGHIDLIDFKNYQANIKNSLYFNYKNKKVYTTPFPSLGGSVIGLGLGEMASYNRNVSNANSSKHIERLLPVLKKMEHTTRKPEILIKELQTYQNILSTKKWGSTTHFNILDKDGNAVAITVSNGEGSGYIMPHTNCFMNNMLGEAALLPEGFFSWKENIRLHSLMSPTIVANENNEVEIVTGTGGAGRIPSAIFQVLHYLIDYGLSVEEAVHAPRMHLQEHLLNIEPPLVADFHNNDGIDYHHWENKYMYFGGVHTIQKKKDIIEAIGDSRRFGVVKKVE